MALFFGHTCAKVADNHCLRYVKARGYSEEKHHSCTNLWASHLMLSEHRVSPPLTREKSLVLPLTLTTAARGTQVVLQWVVEAVKLHSASST